MCRKGCLLLRLLWPHSTGSLHTARGCAAPLAAEPELWITDCMLVRVQPLPALLLKVTCKLATCISSSQDVAPATTSNAPEYPKQGLGARYNSALMWPSQLHRNSLLQQIALTFFHFGSLCFSWFWCLLFSLFFFFFILCFVGWFWIFPLGSEAGCQEKLLLQPNLILKTWLIPW